MTVLPAAAQPEVVDFFTVDGMAIKYIAISGYGSIVPQHSHALDHSTFVAVGSLYAWKDGEYLGHYEAPCVLFIEAGTKHTFQTTAEKTIIACIHNLHGEQAIKILAEHELEFD